MGNYICAVNGCVAPNGICGAIICGSSECGSIHPCEHQRKPPCKQCGGKLQTKGGDAGDPWWECEDCGTTA